MVQATGEAGARWKGGGEGVIFPKGGRKATRRGGRCAACFCLPFVYFETYEVEVAGSASEASFLLAARGVDAGECCGDGDFAAKGGVARKASILLVTVRRSSGMNRAVAVVAEMVIVLAKRLPLINSRDCDEYIGVGT